MVTTLGKVVTYRDKLPPRKACDPLINWSTWGQAKAEKKNYLDIYVTYGH